MGLKLKPADHLIDADALNVRLQDGEPIPIHDPRAQRLVDLIAMADSLYYARVQLAVAKMNWMYHEAGLFKIKDRNAFRMMIRKLEKATQLLVEAMERILADEGAELPLPPDLEAV